MKPILRELTNLVRGETSTVSLKARTILIASEKPSYEIRHNHIEKMFLDAINKSDDTSQVKHFSFLSHSSFNHTLHQVWISLFCLAGHIENGLLVVHFLRFYQPKKMLAGNIKLLGTFRAGLRFS